MLIRGFYSWEFSFLVTNIAANFLSATDRKMANVMLNLITVVKDTHYMQGIAHDSGVQIEVLGCYTHACQLPQSMKFKQVWCCLKGWWLVVFCSGSQSVEHGGFSNGLQVIPENLTSLTLWNCKITSWMSVQTHPFPSTDSDRHLRFAKLSILCLRSFGMWCHVVW
jgi:hypothetical protein